MNPDAETNLWLVGVINAAPYIASAFLGCWLSDPLNNWFGRRGAIFIAAIFLILTPIGSALCQTWEQLLVCRLLMGIGMGLKGSTVSVPNKTNQHTSPSWFWFWLRPIRGMADKLHRRPSLRQRILQPPFAELWS